MNKNFLITFFHNKVSDRIFADSNDVALWLIANDEKELAERFLEKSNKMREEE